MLLLFIFGLFVVNLGGGGGGGGAKAFLPPTSCLQDANMAT